MDLARLHADVTALLAPAEEVPESALTVQEDMVVMTALLGNTMPPLDSSRKRPAQATLLILRRLDVRGKRSICSLRRPRGIYTWWGEGQQQAREVDVGLSGSLNTTDDVTLIDEGTVDGVPGVDPAGFRKPGPPASWEI